MRLYNTGQSVELSQAKQAQQGIIRQDILNHLHKLQVIDSKGRVDLHDTQAVKDRTGQYFNLCADQSRFPSVMGLATQLGITRQALHAWMIAHPTHKTTEYINVVKDVFADLLVNQSLHNNAQVVQAIFQLKNHFGHADQVQIMPVQDTSTTTQTVEDLRNKYADYVEDDQ